MSPRGTDSRTLSDTQIPGCSRPLVNPSYAWILHPWIQSTLDQIAVGWIADMKPQIQRSDYEWEAFLSLYTAAHYIFHSVRFIPGLLFAFSMASALASIGFCKEKQSFFKPCLRPFLFVLICAMQLLWWPSSAMCLYLPLVSGSETPANWPPGLRI